MFPCSVCQKVFKNWFQLRAHTKTCFSDTLMQSATVPHNVTMLHNQPIVLEADTPSNDTIVDDACDIDTNTASQIMPSSTGPILEPSPLLFNWRGAAPDIQAFPQATPSRFDPKQFNYHEVLIARDVRRHETALPWTNKNYSVLSQVVNSLSLSQSDTDRLLNAVSKDLPNICKLYRVFVFRFVG